MTATDWKEIKGPGHVQQTRQEFEEIQRKLKCFACDYANKDNLGIGPCCGYPEGLPHYNKDGSCAVRKEE